MRLLLDTHIFLWSFREPEKLSKAVSRELTNEENELWLSPVSIWECLKLSEKKRVVFLPDPETWIRTRMMELKAREAVLNHEVAFLAARLKLVHSDPIDRFLAATAAVHDLTLVTADSKLFPSSEYSTLPNL